MPDRDIYVCLYCTIGHHEDVECGGIYYCPNPLCSGSGGSWMRCQIPSYQEEENGRHSVDWTEWRKRAREYLMELPTRDEAVWRAFEVEEAKIIEMELRQERERTGRRLEVLQDQ
jgi:hypothetical protein